MKTVPSNQSLSYEEGMSLQSKSWFYPVFAGALLISGLVFVLYFTIQPRTLPKIKPSGFKNETEIASAIHQRLQQEIQQNRIFFVGVSEIESSQGAVLVEFLKDFQAIHPDIQRYLFDAQILSSLQKLPEFQSIKVEVLSYSLPQQIQDFFTAFSTAANDAIQNQQGGVLVVLPTLQVTKRFEDSIVSTLFRDQKTDAIPAMSILFANYFIATDQKVQVALDSQYEAGKSFGTNIPCHTSEKDQAGTGDLGCLIMRLSRVNERKLLKYKNLSGFMDQISSNEYLMVIKNTPNETVM